MPTAVDAAAVTEELRARSKVPLYLTDVLHSLPPDTHPMTQFATLVMALQVRSRGSVGRTESCG